MLTLCRLLVMICVVLSSRPPQIEIRWVSINTLELSCKATDNKTELRRIYRVQNGNFKLIVSVIENGTTCQVTPMLPTESVQCDCHETFNLVCNVTGVHNEGEHWQCATFPNKIPVYSNIATILAFTKKTTAQDLTSVSSRMTSVDNAEKVTKMSTEMQVNIAATTISMIHSYSINQTSPINTEEESFVTKASQNLSNDTTFYRRFIIIISASAVVVVLIAASLLIFVYRKYDHLSGALEAPGAPVVDTPNTRQRPSPQMPENVTENRQSTIEIYETIQMTMLSPMADSYPLPIGMSILDILGSGSDSSVESIHHYDIVPDALNELSPNGAEAVADPHLTAHVLYESLIGTRTTP
ncbi:uncharacterized protein LOC127882051 [Dreissena polymorpha]|uniref:Uncharacterized protein n=1 Tax=Dreissena polymorpha TaxID=45954 RepID=A0A9D4GL25_DREPO|nr:uncharacterized protein LOC127882051 [Dreissena polymorpha]KAH3817438.1 hypothetical protein DPMN_118974 [Dreissena polymorpha]